MAAAVGRLGRRVRQGHPGHRDQGCASRHRLLLVRQLPGVDPRQRPHVPGAAGGDRRAHHRDHADSGPVHRHRRLPGRDPELLVRVRRQRRRQPGDDRGRDGADPGLAQRRLVRAGPLVLPKLGTPGTWASCSTAVDPSHQPRLPSARPDRLVTIRAGRPGKRPARCRSRLRLARATTASGCQLPRRGCREHWPSAAAGHRLPVGRGVDPHVGRPHPDAELPGKPGEPPGRGVRALRG